MNIRFQDLNHYQLDDGTVRLEQIGYAGEETVIDAHPLQITFIARQLCGMKPETANQVADLERRIAVLTDKLQSIVCKSEYRSEVIEGLDIGFELMAKLDGLLDLALEFDGGRLNPEPPCGDNIEAGGVSKPPHPSVATTQAKKTQQSAIASNADSNPNLYALLQTGNGS